MSSTRRIKWIVSVALLLVLVGVGVYLIGVHLWGRQQIRAAEEALQRRDFQAARLCLDRYLRIRPGDESALLLAAQTARRQGDFDRAREHLRLCQRTDGMKDALILESNLLAIQEGDLTEVPPMLATCADNPSAAETPLMLEAILEGSLRVLSRSDGVGLALHETIARPHLDSAKQALDQWLRDRPGQPDQVQGLVWRGRLHALENRHAEAVADLRKALELDPEHFQARFQLTLLIAQKAPEEVAQHLQFLLQRQPDNPQVLFALASVQHSLGKLDEAGRILDNLLLSYGNAVPYLVVRGEVAVDANQLEDAERWLRQALELAPDQPAIHRALSRCLNKMGRTSEAKQHQDRSLELDAEQRRQREQMPERRNKQQESR